LPARFNSTKNPQILRPNLRRHEVSPFPQCELGQLPVAMPNNTQTKTPSSEALSANPFVVARDMIEVGRGFFIEVGSLFWFVVNTFGETIERIRNG